MATKVSTDVNSINAIELEQKVKDMYSEVALNPHGEFHFEMGRVLAERLGYLSEDLDHIPAEAIDSFAGVGYYFHLANLNEGESVIDLGSGSGMDTFVAALKVGKNGKVVGVDMTDEQRAKAERLRDQAGFNNVTYLKSYIDAIPCEDGSFDAVISNGVINLVADKGRLFREAARILKTNGRLAISDIVTEVQLPEGISCDTTLWAACIGGAMQQDSYRGAIEAAGLSVRAVQENPQYKFISENARGASKKFGVKSISLLAVKV
ncbi:methyltransferase domain-containing protein [Desulfobacterota bacterium AH_259_B03_O07]|nr:methyltransferase domain-containing protein [Desulfobacterota bacterium AH_259_B03_O07]